MNGQLDMRGKTAVIIVDYNSEALLRRCMTSLAALGREDLVFIVVDNGGSLEADRLLADFPGTTVLRPGENTGFAGGCNLGLGAALDGDAAWCLLLNPDTRAETDFIGPLRDAFEDDARLGMACPTILNDDETRGIWFAGGDIDWWQGRPMNITDGRLRDRGGVQQVPCLTGCAMMLRPGAVREAGLMDDRYFLYFEDSDYTRAFIGAGWRTAYVPRAEVLHKPSSTTGYQSERYVYYFARNRILFMRRRGRWHHRVVFTLFHALVRLPGAIIVFAVLRGRPRLALAFLRGWLDGMLRR